ncbi:DUF6617 family protein [Lutibacter sp.]|uniref:DUF6617 family protein n=1 Tax=Lutibacter sp. TaxID=1925666 RepID=UPI002734451D|nr:DUF6617 family protein [Lutibacter sp.]MDP3314088.1 hypothetical protein [Lutibacter sp.]
MKQHIFSSLISITKGLHRDLKTEQEYRSLNLNNKQNLQFKAAPNFEIVFKRALSEKKKYYKSIIDIEANCKFNDLINGFPKNAVIEENLFNYNLFHTEYHQNLINTNNYINKHSLTRNSIDEDNVFIIHYLKANMIWIYIELQDRYSQYSNEEILSTEEIYKHYFNENLTELEIIPAERIVASIKPKKEIINFIAIQDDLLKHRTQKDNILPYNTIVQNPKSMARAEEMMFEAGIIDKDYNFMDNIKAKNKSVLGVLYFLFINKDYFNKATYKPFKKIKNPDIVRFLNHRYNTDARKQFKTFEKNDNDRNELISNEYILKNLPNQIR